MLDELLLLKRQPGHEPFLAGCPRAPLYTSKIPLHPFRLSSYNLSFSTRPRHKEVVSSPRSGDVELEIHHMTIPTPTVKPLWLDTWGSWVPQVNRNGTHTSCSPAARGGPAGSTDMGRH